MRGLSSLPPWCHPNAGLLREDTGVLGSPLPFQMLRHGLLQPQSQAMAVGEVGRGLGARAFPAASGHPAGARMVDEAVPRLGFLSVSTRCRNSPSEREQRGFLIRGEAHSEQELKRHL